MKTTTEPKWIVNSLGDLGVEINGRCFFLYKGDNIEYDPADRGENEKPILFRRVGKREFGETVWPFKWYLNGRCEDYYDEECVYNHSLSSGPPNDPEFRWKPIPKPPKPTP